MKNVPGGYVYTSTNTGTATWQAAPGIKLAKNVYAPATQTTSTVSTTVMAAFDTNNLQTGLFTAPSSGAVTVRVTMVGKTSTSGVWVGLGLGAHGTVTPLVSNEWVWESSTSDAQLVYTEFTVSGLNAGIGYNFDLLGCCTNTDTFVVYAFGQTTVTPNVSGSAGQGAPVTFTILAD